MIYKVEETFENIDFTPIPFEQGEYEGCTFNNCNLQNVDLSGSKFIEVEFKDCNLSNAQIANVLFQDVSFGNCKMLGLQFDQCNDFGFSVTFKACVLDHSILYKMKLQRTSFNSCQLKGVDFTEANLKACFMQSCDLSDAIFENTILEKADLRYSYNYSIDPENNRIAKAKFSLQNIIGLLSKYNIEIE